MYTIRSSPNSEIFTSFAVWICFTASSCLIAVAWISSTLLNESGETGLLSKIVRMGNLSFSWSCSQLLTVEYDVAADAAKSLQLCPTLCDPIDGSPPGSAVPGILQARVVEWVNIAFSEEKVAKSRKLLNLSDGFMGVLCITLPAFTVFENFHNKIGSI